jgi:hypothetical protein
MASGPSASAKHLLPNVLTMENNCIDPRSLTWTDSQRHASTSQVPAGVEQTTPEQGTSLASDTNYRIGGFQCQIPRALLMLVHLLQFQEMVNPLSLPNTRTTTLATPPFSNICPSSTHSRLHQSGNRTQAGKIPQQRHYIIQIPHI